MKCVVFFLACALSAQVAERANENYKSPEQRAKFAVTIARTSRDERQKPKELVTALEIKPGMTVADVGTAAGYMLPYLSEAVGPSGKVLAEDIYPDFLEAANKNTTGRQNIEFTLGNEKSTNLPADSADLILVLDVYHHLNYPAAMLADLKRVLKPDGRLVIVEYHKNEKSMNDGFALKHIRLTDSEAVKEIEANGWKLVSKQDFLPEVQWMAIFTEK